MFSKQASVEIIANIGNVFRAVGAVFAAPFSLIFAHGGGIQWNEQSLTGKLLIIAITLPVLTGLIIGWPLLVIGEYLIKMGAD